MATRTRRTDLRSNKYDDHYHENNHKKLNNSKFDYHGKLITDKLGQASGREPPFELRKSISRTPSMSLVRSSWPPVTARKSSIRKAAFYTKKSHHFRTNNQSATNLIHRSSSSPVDININNTICRKSKSQREIHQGPKIMILTTAATCCLLVLIVLSTLSGSVQALNCYHCSSADNPSCDEPFTGRANFTDTDCEKHIGRPAKVCRKIVQYIENKKVVIRSCGFIDEHEEKDRKSMCYKRSGTFALMMESCICYEDNCNHSASLVPSYLATLGALVFSAFLYHMTGAARMH